VAPIRRAMDVTSSCKVWRLTVLSFPQLIGIEGRVRGRERLAGHREVVEERCPSVHRAVGFEADLLKGPVDESLRDVHREVGETVSIRCSREFSSLGSSS